MAFFCLPSLPKGRRHLPMERVVIDIATNEVVYKPGQLIQATVNIYCPSAIDVDSIEARLLGVAAVSFTSEDHYNFAKRKSIVDLRKELWRYRSLNSMLDLNVDENDNTESSCCARLSGHLAYDFNFRVPYDAPTSFQCSGAPVAVKYTIEISLLHNLKLVSHHEHQLAVLRPESALGGKNQKSSTHSKHYRFPKDRNVYLECVLDRNVFTTVDSVGVKITVANKWKRSLKYVHICIVRRIVVSGNLVDDEEIEQSHTVLLDTTGVGLPVMKPKVQVGETYTFRPTYNVPALPPTTSVDGIMKNDYFLKICVGRAHNFVIASLKIPITIVSEFVEPKRRSCSTEETLIDFASPIVHDLLA